MTYLTGRQRDVLTFIRDRVEAEEFLNKLTLGEKEALAWAKALPLASSEELVGYH